MGAVNNWYVLKVVTGQEFRVKAQIETELAKQGLEDYVEQILVPSEKVYEVHRGKRRTKERSFFPGYVLVCAHLQDGVVAHVLKTVPSALGFLSTKGWSTSEPPVPVRTHEINRILGKSEDASSMQVAEQTDFSKDELIQVTDGPFSGFSGTIQEVFQERKKLNVIVKIFGRNTPVELGYAQVAKEN